MAQVTENYWTRLYRACAGLSTIALTVPFFYPFHMHQDDPVTRQTWFWYIFTISPIVPPLALFFWNIWRKSYPSRFAQTSMIPPFVWAQALIFLRVFKF